MHMIADVTVIWHHYWYSQYVWIQVSSYIATVGGLKFTIQHTGNPLVILWTAAPIVFFDFSIISLQELHNWFEGRSS